MNRTWIVLACTTDLAAIAPLARLRCAESNSPSQRPLLSGDPEIKDFVKELLAMLPPTYCKRDALSLMQRAVDEVFV